LAHETGHVAARHGAETASKQTALNLASIPLIFVGGVAGVGARQAAGIGIPVAFLKFTRSQEAEADYLGAQYLYKAGYDPSAMLSFFEKLQAKEKKKPGTMSSLFTDHPPTAARVAAVKKEIETILPGRDQYVVTSSEFDAVKARLTSMADRKPVNDQRGPRLRRRSPNTGASDSGADATGNKKDPASTTQSDDRPSIEDDRPVLKRKD